MKIQRLKSIVAAAVCTITFAFPMTAGAVEGLDKTDGELFDGNFTYELVNGSYVITACDPSSIVNEIPELRNGYAITAIGENAFRNCTYINELAIPDTVTSIGDNAFQGCTSLKSVKLPKRITELSSGVLTVRR